MSEISWANIENGKYDVIIITHEDYFNAFLILNGVKLRYEVPYDCSEFFLSLIHGLGKEKMLQVINKLNKLPKNKKDLVRKIKASKKVRKVKID